jgi:hypothetical protein
MATININLLNRVVEAGVAVDTNPDVGQTGGWGLVAVQENGTVVIREYSRQEPGRPTEVSDATWIVDPSTATQNRAEILPAVKRTGGWFPA